MRRRGENLFLLPALIAGISLMLADRATAHTFTNLHTFTGSDGFHPHTSLILSSNILYGTTIYGGYSDNGTVFAINTDGTGFTNLYSFTGGSDGSLPQGGLILSGNTLYGTTLHGGSSGYGTVFAVNVDGTGFTNLYGFTAASGSPATNSDGAYPQSTLVLSGNVLYGTAGGGGSSGYGTLFAVNTDGTSFTNLHTFTGGSDGANPYGGVVLSSNALYGTAYSGGNSGKGTVFAVNIDGAGFTNLYSFTGSGGANTFAGLILSGNTLYGTAYGGGSLGAGTVFAINTDGTGFTNLHSFTVIDGTSPYAGLILSDNTLYGTASLGGGANNGTVFKIKTNGTAFTNLYSFTGCSGVLRTNSDGANPYASLILSGNTLYGTARIGGSFGFGTVFSLSFGTPQIGITLSETNVILTWPTNATWFTLQSATNIDSSVWNTVSPGPVVVNGQNTVTNPISGAQKFYRLSQ